MNQVNGCTKVYGIIGDPVSHSKSPIMHNTGFQEIGSDSIYIPLPVKDIEAGILGLKGLGLYGASVTIPHKETVIPLLDSIDPVAKKIGAVNTLNVIEIDGKRQIHGSNTDWIGANRALCDCIDLAKRKAVILGAGGSARAIGFGLLEAGAEVVLCSRTEKRGRELANELECEWYGLEEVDILRGDILINATSVGMQPKVDMTLVSKSSLASYTVVMDIVYAPLMTRLLKEADEVGCRTVNGLEMLLYQGVAQFELWTGRKAPVQAMRSALLQATGN